MKIIFTYDRDHYFIVLGGIYFIFDRLHFEE